MASKYMPTAASDTTPSTSIDAVAPKDTKFSPTSVIETTPSTSSPRTEESGYFSHEDQSTAEALRRAFQFGRQPRLQNFRFVLDEGLLADFTVEDWTVPHPVIRISRSKFNSIFVHNEQMVRRFKEDPRPRTPDTTDKVRNQRLKARIAAATIDLEHFILMNLTRRKAMLLNQYRTFNSAIRSAAELEENSRRRREM